MSEPTPHEAAMRLVSPADSEAPCPVYSNFVQVNFTPADFTFHFGAYEMPPLLEPPRDAEITVPVRPVAKVTVPLSSVRSIIRLLERQIKGWEESFGETLPDQPEAARPPSERVK